MSSSRAPADYDMAVTGGEDLFDVEVEIGKGRDVDLEELPCAFVPSKRGGKGVRFPRRLQVQSLDECLDVMRIPRCEDLAYGVEVIRPSHYALPLRCRKTSPTPSSPPPPSHAHVAVHRQGCHEMLLGLLRLVSAPKQRAETELTVSDQRAQTQGLGSGES